MKYSERKGDRLHTFFDCHHRLIVAPNTACHSIHCVSLFTNFQYHLLYCFSRRLHRAGCTIITTITTRDAFLMVSQAVCNHSMSLHSCLTTTTITSTTRFIHVSRLLLLLHPPRKANSCFNSKTNLELLQVQVRLQEALPQSTSTRWSIPRTVSGGPGWSVDLSVVTLRWASP